MGIFRKPDPVTENLGEIFGLGQVVAGAGEAVAKANRLLDKVGPFIDKLVNGNTIIESSLDINIPSLNGNIHINSQIRFVPNAQSLSNSQS